jgi:GTP cyclohydrolase I
MRDIQNQRDKRNIGIRKVGVKDIRYPIIVLDKKNETQHTVASINMYVDLPRHFKGTHMSRFIEILNKYRGQINIKSFPTILDEMIQKLKARSAHLEIEFPYFIEKKAPVTGARSLMEYTCRFSGSIPGDKDDMELFSIGIKVPVTTLCPCSKEISARGAHNQRSIVNVNFRFRKFIWIEDIISMVEGSASSDVYALLKRPDEKHLTEKAYDNPMFVEDIVREVAKKLKANPNITWFSVESENFESIHNHSAYAFVEEDKAAIKGRR